MISKDEQGKLGLDPARFIMPAKLQAKMEMYHDISRVYSHCCIGSHSCSVGQLLRLDGCIFVVIKLASVVIAVLIGLLLWTRIIKKRDHRIYSDFNPQCSKKVH